MVNIEFNLINVRMFMIFIFESYGSIRFGFNRFVNILENEI